MARQTFFQMKVEEACHTHSEWQGMRKTFKDQACKNMGLLRPRCSQQVMIPQEGLRESQNHRKWRIEELQLPKLLARDEIWTTNIQHVQLEFVVDNEAVANISNGIIRVSNDFYKAPFDRIRNRLFCLYRERFEYKSGFLDPVDWRPREFNTAADHAANCALASNEDIDTLRTTLRQSICSRTVAIQVFCDGGYVSGRGAAAFVATRVKTADGASGIEHNRRSLDRKFFEVELIGARAILIEGARSSFHSEATALDMATEWAVNALA